MRNAGVGGVGDDHKFMFKVLAERKVFGMGENRTFWRNHGGRGVDNIDGSKNGNVTFGNIYGGIGRTEGKF